MTPVVLSYVAAGACYLGLEYWLGKTDKVKAGSTLELALNVAKSACSFLVRR